MHFEILVEDQSGLLLIDKLIPKILGSGSEHSWRLHPYKGIGRVPKNLANKTDPSKRALLNQLPRILAGYGKSLAGQDAAVVVVIDLDDRNCVEFKQELVQIAKQCNPAPTVLFRLAIEEMEAWLLGDKGAILRAYPKAKSRALDAYVPDSVCGTWETLADAITSGGSARLKKEGYPRVGQEKCAGASSIAPHIDIDANRSPSFHAFRQGLLKLITATPPHSPPPST